MENLYIELGVLKLVLCCEVHVVVDGVFDEIDGEEELLYYGHSLDIPDAYCDAVVFSIRPGDDISYLVITVGH